MNAYIDLTSFQLLALGANTLGLFGGNTQLSQSAVQGATSLNVYVPAGFEASQPVYILDGASSEMIFSSASPTTPGQTTLALASGTQFPHGQNVSVSSSGQRGSLAQLILSASAWVETFCQQGSAADRGFFQKTHTENILQPSTRAYLDPDYTLTIRPRWLPVTSITSMAYTWAAGVTIPLDQTQAIFETNNRLIYVPSVQPLGNLHVQGWQLQGPTLMRDDQVWLNITYTAGFAPGAVPIDFQQAVVWVTQEFLAYASNPTGAAIVRQGNVQIEQRLRGSGNKEASTDGIFLTQAKFALQPYRAQYV